MDRLLRDYRLIARSPLSVDGAAVRAALRHRCIWSREPPILLSTIPWLWTDGRVQVARTERYVHSLGDFYRAASEGRLGFGEKRPLQLRRWPRLPTVFRQQLGHGLYCMAWKPEDSR